MQLPDKPLQVLLVEDNPGDALLALEGLKSDRTQVDVEVVGKGEDALQYLNHEGPYEKASNPDVMLLDLHLPRMSGQEVLTQVKSNPKLKGIPIFVLLGSKTEEEIVRSSGVNADGYLLKPVEIKQLIQLLNSY
jgi:two-component system, chemotaxis family, response regulator Rcp1